MVNIKTNHRHIARRKPILRWSVISDATICHFPVLRLPHTTKTSPCLCLQLCETCLPLLLPSGLIQLELIVESSDGHYPALRENHLVINHLLPHPTATWLTGTYAQSPKLPPRCLL